MHFDTIAKGIKPTRTPINKKDKLFLVVLNRQTKAYLRMVIFRKRYHINSKKKNLPGSVTGKHRFFFSLANVCSFIIYSPDVLNMCFFWLKFRNLGSEKLEGLNITPTQIMAMVSKMRQVSNKLRFYIKLG